MNDTFRHFMAEGVTHCQESLSSTLNALLCTEVKLDELNQATRYTLSSGGKHIRAVLAYAAAKSVGQDEFKVCDAGACAIELLHTYSLIHDDLPAMDNDDLRRGKPSLHKAYNEAIAILVGDGLQAMAFEVVADAPGLNAGQKVAMLKVLASAAGPRGMVGGQYIDIQSTGTNISLKELQSMHSLKTGALIRASLALGGISANASDEQLTALDNYGTHIGLAFQVVDDILDVESNTKVLGKTQGKDSDANKPTYVKLMGLDAAKEEASHLRTSALTALAGFGKSADQLRNLARYIVERDR